MYDTQELISRYAISQDLDPTDPSILDWLCAHIEMAIEQLDGEIPSDTDTDWSGGLWTWAECDYLYRNLPT